MNLSYRVIVGLAVSIGISNSANAFGGFADAVKTRHNVGITVNLTDAARTRHSVGAAGTNPLYAVQARHSVGAVQSAETSVQSKKSGAQVDSKILNLNEGF